MSRGSEAGGVLLLAMDDVEVSASLLCGYEIPLCAAEPGAGLP